MLINHPPNNPVHYSLLSRLHPANTRDSFINSQNKKMKLFRVGLAAVLAVATLGSVYAQTADEIVNKHLDAVGGKAKIAQLNSIRTESSIDIAGQKAPSTTTILNGKGFRNEVDFGGQKMIQVVT